MSTRTAVKAAIAVVAILVVFQAIPYGRDRTNPVATAHPNWRTAEARDAAGRACANCHSNATVWPWYSYVAPVSWLVQRDVDRARRAMNFSDWDQRQPAARDAVALVYAGAMPPRHYALVHWGARLSAFDRDVLVRDLASILPDDPAWPEAEPPALEITNPILGLGEW